MKFALVAGPSASHLIQEFNFGYHLVLAQQCLRNPFYKEFYRQCARRGHHIILDNGAAELQHSISFNEVLSVASYIGADEIVVPDALGDFEETCTMWETYKDEIPQRSRMGVPQGETWEEWQQAFMLMILGGVRTIGVAKRYEQFEGGRLEALRFIQNSGHSGSIDVHMLGCWSNPIGEVDQIVSHFPWVRGLDTAAPLAHAQQRLGMLGRAGEKYGHIPYEWDEPYDEERARQNIADMYKACISF